MQYKIVIIKQVSLLLTCLNYFQTLAQDKGFELLFQSNENEYEDLIFTLEGDIPTWLKGRLIRNGIGKLEMGERKFLHTFDGYAKLTSFTLNGSKTATFSSKFIQSKSYTQSKEGNDIAPYVLFDRPDPPFSKLQQMKQLYNGIDNTNVNICGFVKDRNSSERQIMALSDFWSSYHINPDNLETLSHVHPPLPTAYNLGSYVPLPSTSHPVKEKNKDSLISYVSYTSTIPFVPNYINVIRLHTVTERENIVSIERESLPYMHSIGLSENYAVLFADPLYINHWKILENVQPLESLEWKPEENTTILVVNLNTTQVTKIQVKPKVHMHFVNAFEKNKKLYVDYIYYKDFNFMKGMLVQNLHNESRRNEIEQSSRLIRYKININLKTVKVNEFRRRKRRQFVNRMDFPTINENFRHKRYCYIYGLVLKSDSQHLAHNSIVKKDLCDGEDKYWTHKNEYASEPIFVPSPNSSDEDDGVLLSVILNGKKKASYLAIFCAKSLDMIAKGYLPDYIPFSLHGHFYPF